MIKDKLFLLSIEELKKYLPDEKSRICMYEGVQHWWWLRSPSSYANSAAYVSSNGYLDRDGYVIGSISAVRPALHLNLSYLQTLKRNKEDCVTFGNREWMVLDEETGLLISKDAMCKRRFDESSNNYEHSEIRAYLNTELLNGLFTEEEQKLIVDTIIDGEESSLSDMISRKEVLSTLKNVFDEYRMSYGEQYKGFAADVPKAIKAIPAAYDEKTKVCEPEYLGENHLIGCRDGRCFCGNIVKSFQNFCDACGIQLEWGNVWGQN